MSYPIFEVDIPVQEGSDSGLMNVHVSIPVVEKAAPAVMVFQEAFGVNQHIRDILQRLSTLGYLAVAPELFHRTGPRFHADDYSDMAAVQPHTAKISSKGIIVDAQATYNWLMMQPQVGKHRIAALGFCLGGRAAYLANATLPLRAAVSCYGGHIKDSLLNLVEDQHGDMLFFGAGGMSTSHARTCVSSSMRCATSTKRIPPSSLAAQDTGFSAMPVRPIIHALPPNLGIC